MLTFAIVLEVVAIGFLAARVIILAVFPSEAGDVDFGMLVGTDEGKERQKRREDL